MWAVHAPDPSTGGSGAQGHSLVSLRETQKRREQEEKELLAYIILEPENWSQKSKTYSSREAEPE